MYRLLIVEDELHTREGLLSLIPNFSLPIQIIGSASNGALGLELACRHNPDIIITDIRMPQMDGISFSKTVHERNPDCQFIFISAYSDKTYFKAAISIQAIDYIEKPIDQKELSHEPPALLVV